MHRSYHEIYINSSVQILQLLLPDIGFWAPSWYKSMLLNKGQKCKTIMSKLNIVRLCMSTELPEGKKKLSLRTRATLRLWWIVLVLILPKLNQHLAKCGFLFFSFCVEVNMKVTLTRKKM